MDSSKFVFVALALSLTLKMSADVPGVSRAKVLGLGWDTLAASPSEILENADAFDRSGLDGVFAMVSGVGEDGTRYDARYVSKNEPWTKAMVSDAVAALSQFRNHRGLRESCVFGWFASRSRIGWDDDAGWARFAGNVAVLAYVAKASGLGRLHLDNEDYPGSRQYYYDAKLDGPSYEDVCRKARRRGAEIGRAVFGEFPELSLGFMWILSEHRPYFTCADPMEEKRKIGDLWPDFVNGLLDSLPDGAKLVDGDEHCYYADADGHDFYRHFWNQRQGALRLVAPENRAKYLSQVSISGGIYLDMFVNDPKSTWYFGPGADGTRVGRFAGILSEGARVATDYVWVYGEKHAFIDWRRDSVHCGAGKDKRFDKVRAEGRYTWESALPGYTVALRQVTDSRNLAKEALSADKGNLLNWRSYGSWQHERRRQGTFSTDSEDAVGNEFSLVAKGVAQGCFIYNLPAKPGEIYAVCGAVKGRGAITVTWSSEGKLTANERQYSLPLSAADDKGWAKGAMAVCVPPGMDKLVVHPGVSKQEPDEVTKFSGIRVVRISTGSCP